MFCQAKLRAEMALFYVWAEEPTCESRENDSRAKAPKTPGDRSAYAHAMLVIEGGIIPPSRRNLSFGCEDGRERQRGWLERLPEKLHACLFGQAAPFAIVACVARGHDVLPYGLAAANAGHDVVVVEGHHGLALAAVLAAKTIAGEDVHTREAHLVLFRHVSLGEPNDG